MCIAASVGLLLASDHGRAQTATPTPTATASPTFISTPPATWTPKPSPTASPTEPLTNLKQPSFQNLFLTAQGAKLAPESCDASTNVAVFRHTLSGPITSPDPKNPSETQRLGSFEFEVLFDEGLVCVNIAPGQYAIQTGMTCFVDDKNQGLQPDGLARIGCTTKGKNIPASSSLELAVIEVRPQPELYSIIRANQDNGVVAQLLNQGCNLGDLQGHPIQKQGCDDSDLTIRWLEGDVNGDCAVDVRDQQLLAFRWGAQLGGLLYNNRFDLEPSGQIAGDGDIDIKDVQFVYGRHGSTCAVPHPPQPPRNPKQTDPSTTPTPTPQKPTKAPLGRFPPPNNPSGSCGSCGGGDGPPDILLDSGQVFRQETHLAIPSGRSLSYAHDVCYYQGWQIDDGAFGSNTKWEHSYETKLHIVVANDPVWGTVAPSVFGKTPEPGDIVRNNGYCRLDLYKFDEATGRFISPRGFYNELYANGNGTFDLRERDGTVFSYDVKGTLTRIEDRNGNALRFVYNSQRQLIQVIEPLGRTTTYDYDSDGRLEQVEDFTGRTVTYDYDTDGNLAEWTGPPVTGAPNGNDFPGGKTTRYDYDTDHRIESITAPNEVESSGPPHETFDYDTTPGYSFGRVTDETLGGTNASGVPAGGTYEFEYQELNPGNSLTDPNMARNQTRVTDRNGNLVEYVHNGPGNELEVREFTNRNVKPSDPPKYVTRHQYNKDLERIETILPEGNHVIYDYDVGAPTRFQQGNELSETRIPDPARGGDQPRITTTYDYDPIYNQVRSSTEERGNDCGSYIPPNGGACTPGRYTTSHTYDYQEGSNLSGLAAEIHRTPAETGTILAGAGVSLGLGDQNGDGSTSQLAGNAVRTDAPTVSLLPGSPQITCQGDASQETVSLARYNQFGQVTRTDDPEGNVDLYEYHPENDPDGDGLDLTPSVGGGPGGYLKAVTRDALSAAGRNCTNPPPAAARTAYFYDRVGNTTREIDPRGIETRYIVNQLNQVVRTTRADNVSAAKANPEEPSGPNADRGLLAFDYVTDTFYDANDNVVRREVENSDSNNGSLAGGTIVTTYDYDILDNLVKESQEVSESPPEGITTRYRYDENENEALVIKPMGNSTTYIYDERDLPSQSTNGATSPPPGVLLAPGDPTTYDPKGGQPSTTTHNYDRNGNATSSTDAQDNTGDGVGETTRYDYDGFDREVRTTDGIGNVTEHHYDAAGDVVRTSSCGPVGGASPTTAPTRVCPPSTGTSSYALLSRSEYSYDELGRQFQRDDLLFDYSGLGVSYQRAPVLVDGPLSIANDSRVTTRTDYDRDSRRTFSVEDDLSTAESRYDGLGRVLREIDPENNEALYSYDDNDNVVRVKEIERTQSGNSPSLTECFVTLNVYDSLDRLIRTTDNVGQTTRYEYDSRDDQIRTSDAQNPKLIADPLGLFPDPDCATGGATQINQPGNRSETLYDGLSRTISEIQELRAGGHGNGAIDTSNPSNPDGKVTYDYDYDANSRLVAMADDGSVTDGSGNAVDHNNTPGVIESVAPLGNVTRYEYDNLDRRTRETFDDGTTTTYSYDRDDNVTSLTDANGSARSMPSVGGYDGINRPVQVDVTRGAGVAGTTQQTFEYDGLSRATRSFDNNDPLNGTDDATTTYVYDSLSRPLEEAQNGTPVSSQWMGDDNRLKLTYPNDRQVDYSYDPSDRIDGIRNNGASADLANYDYIGPGRVLERTYENGVRLTYLNDAQTADIGYDADRRVVRQRHMRADNSVVADFEHAYDRADNKTFENRQHSGKRDEYTYDSLYRLTDFQRDKPIGGGPAAQTRTWDLDGVGNWQKFNGSANQVNNLNEYDELKPPCPTAKALGPTDFGFTGDDFKHDCNGNQTQDGANRYVYDFLNRLIKVTRIGDNTVIGAYTYDADGCAGGMNGCGRRVTRSFVDDTDSDTVRYLYDGIHEIEERSATGAVQQYVVGMRIDEWLTLDKDPDGDGAIDETLFYHEDAKTSEAALTDATGACSERYTYDAYGTPRFEDCANAPILGAFKSAEGNPHLFTGRRLDPETALYYYRARYLNAETGRFVQRDPAGFANLLNSYEYVHSSPTRLVDPLGLDEDRYTKMSCTCTFWCLRCKKLRTEEATGEAAFKVNVPELLDPLKGPNAVLDIWGVITEAIKNGGEPGLFALFARRACKKAIDKLDFTWDWSSSCNKAAAFALSKETLLGMSRQNTTKSWTMTGGWRGRFVPNAVVEGSCTATAS